MVVEECGDPLAVEDDYLSLSDDAVSDEEEPEPEQNVAAHLESQLNIADEDEDEPTPAAELAGDASDEPTASSARPASQSVRGRARRGRRCRVSSSVSGARWAGGGDRLGGHHPGGAGCVDGRCCTRAPASAPPSCPR
jgi:hypothetical protein